VIAYKFKGKRFDCGSVEGFVEATNAFYEIDLECVRRKEEAEKGTGFGLTICHELVLKQNGKIWVESQEGIGSKFLFSLPN
jgi:signal transduction histidine kinase